MADRKSGVLLHISSLPGKYGIGSFGQEAVQFARFLKGMGFSYWQTLPFGTTDECNSPYKSFSAFAGNPYFIDLDRLKEDGLLTDQELLDHRYPDPYSVDFAWLSRERIPLLRKAFSRITPALTEKVQSFAEEQGDWLPDYALYMAIKNANGQKDWYTWERPLKLREPSAIQEAQEKYSSEILFQEFLQYEFFTQWQETKKQINEIGVKIIGDMPIYLSLESSDVWSHRELFALNEDGSPDLVAGVPPDYYSADGQKWGNPLYDWKAMKESGYQWWIQRLRFSFKIYDMVRIDHFRGFSAYWAVPAKAETAKEGSWMPGPGMDLFQSVFSQFDSPQIIAEDLGVMDADVVKLLEDTGFPCMRVMQFAFLAKDNNIHLPHNYAFNTVAYTGTHDNNTLLGWLWEITPEQRKFALDYCHYQQDDWSQGGPDSSSCFALISALWQSHAMLTIVPFQDLCGYGSDTKMNQPGVSEGNWQYRATEEAIKQVRQDKFLELNRLFFRSCI